jgi:hypothetical protein
MKRYSIYTIIMILGLFMLGSCSDDEFDKSSNVKEGVPVKLTLSMSTSELQQITTKAALSSVDFNAVYDVYVFIYNKDHQLEAKQDFTYTPAKTSGSVTFNSGVTSGVKYIYAVANASQNGMLTELNNIQTGSSPSALQEVTFTLSQKTLQRAAGNLMMSGSLFYTGQEETGYCVVPVPSTEGGGVTITTGSIKLDHLDSQITFNIKSGNSSIKFIPEGWALYNAPQTSNVIEQSEDVANQNLFNTAEDNFETNITTGDITSGSFVFYMMENRKAANGEPASVNARETMESDGQTYTYANDKASYVQIKGTYKEYDASGKLHTYGDVVYTVHLGNFMKKYDNFNSERNKNYTYNITVNGVDDIIAEVTEKEAENDGADGHIYRSSNLNYMDAHYGTAVVTFNQSDGYNFLVGINTPKGTEQLYKYGDNVSNLTDYKWVMFVRNYNASTSFAQYPGDSYTKDNGETTGKYSTDASPLMSIVQVIAELKANATNSSFWTNSKVTYTAFVNEYYYEDLAWRKFVNADDRTFSIYLSTFISSDGKSTYSEPSFRITQRSIQTFYNTELTTETLPTAWGVEAMNEDSSQKLAGVDVTDDNNILKETKTNGRYNTFKQIGYKKDGDLKWSTYVDFTTNTLTSKKDRAIYAFLTRNRDLDGDGYIDADEIRWYTCATNQYVGMWIGQDALSSESRLFQGDISLITETNRFYYHLLSSNNVRFWPEEGVSTGSNYMGARNGGYYFFIRCARNLGDYYTGVPTVSGEPLSYVITDKSTYIDLSRMNATKALRSGDNVFRSEIVEHTEHKGGSLNKPYTSFKVYPNSVKTDCPTGYRTPNQRELALMAGFLTNMADKGSITSSTLSALSYKSNGYYGLVSGGGSVGQYITVNTNVEYSYRRCIRDGLN